MLLSRIVSTIVAAVGLVFLSSGLTLNGQGKTAASANKQQDSEAVDAAASFIEKKLFWEALEKINNGHQANKSWDFSMIRGMALSGLQLQKQASASFSASLASAPESMKSKLRVYLADSQKALKQLSAKKSVWELSVYFGVSPSVRELVLLNNGVCHIGDADAVIVEKSCTWNRKTQLEIEHIFHNSNGDYRSRYALKENGATLAGVSADGQMGGPMGPAHQVTGTLE
jgi:hypothetical protein